MTHHVGVGRRGSRDRSEARLVGREQLERRRFADDLDADSLDLVELVMALEEEFGVEVPEDELEGIKTVGQAYELVVGKL